MHEGKSIRGERRRKASQQRSTILSCRLSLPIYTRRRKGDCGHTTRTRFAVEDEKKGSFLLFRHMNPHTVSPAHRWLENQVCTNTTHYQGKQNRLAQCISRYFIFIRIQLPRVEESIQVILQTFWLPVGLYRTYFNPQNAAATHHASSYRMTYRRPLHYQKRGLKRQDRDAEHHRRTSCAHQR